MLPKSVFGILFEIVQSICNSKLCCYLINNMQSKQFHQATRKCPELLFDTNKRKFKKSKTRLDVQSPFDALAVLH